MGGKWFFVFVGGGLEVVGRFLSFQLLDWLYYRLGWPTLNFHQFMRMLR